MSVKKYAKLIYRLTVGWLILMGAIVLADGTKFFGFSLDNSVLMTLIGSTTHYPNFLGKAHYTLTKTRTIYSEKYVNRAVHITADEARSVLDTASCILRRGTGRDRDSVLRKSATNGRRHAL